MNYAQEYLDELIISIILHVDHDNDKLPSACLFLLTSKQ